MNEDLRPLVRTMIDSTGLSASFLIAKHFNFDGIDYNHPHDAGDCRRVAMKLIALPALESTLIDVCETYTGWRAQYFEIQKQLRHLKATADKGE